MDQACGWVQTQQVYRILVGKHFGKFTFEDQEENGRITLGWLRNVTSDELCYYCWGIFGFCYDNVSSMTSVRKVFCAPTSLLLTSTFGCKYLPLAHSVNQTFSLSTISFAAVNHFPYSQVLLALIFNQCAKFVSRIMLSSAGPMISCSLAGPIVHFGGGDR